jgi:two-component system, OmpR family, sensor histidine kinase KdpD
LPKSILTIFVRFTVCLTLVAITTAACQRVFAVNATTAGFAYLMGVLAIATAWGFLLAAVASVAAMLCLNYFFLPPIGQFTIADPQNWVALFTFLATALVASHLSDRAQRQALDALSRQRETEQLYALSRSILLSEPGVSVASQLVQHLAQIFECDAVALFDAHNGEVIRGGPEEIPAIETTLKQAVTLSVNTRDEEGRLTIAVINLGGRPIGSLALRGSAISDGALQALANLVAIALERVRTGEAASRAEIARQSEEFKSTLLDAIAHEFKTPLTSIKAASTSILSDSAGMSPQLKELTTIIDEEADRLSLLVTEAVRMSQIDAGKVRLDRKRFDLKPLLETLVEQFAPRAEGRKLTLSVSGRLPQLNADADLVMLALRQLLDNALKYSPEGTPVEVAVGEEPGRITVRVLDQGPGIPMKERERIFDKYYRMQSAKQNTSGSGLGLHIAREIMRAHGGDLWVESMHGVGSEFCAAIPVDGLGGAE